MLIIFRLCCSKHFSLTGKCHSWRFLRMLPCLPSSFLLWWRLCAAQGSRVVRPECAPRSLPDVHHRRPAVPRRRPAQLLAAGVCRRPPAGGNIFGRCTRTHVCAYVKVRKHAQDKDLCVWLDAQLTPKPCERSSLLTDSLSLCVSSFFTCSHCKLANHSEIWWWWNSLAFIKWTHLPAPSKINPYLI